MCSVISSNKERRPYRLCGYREPPFSVTYPLRRTLSQYPFVSIAVKEGQADQQRSAALFKIAANFIFEDALTNYR